MILKFYDQINYLNQFKMIKSINFFMLNKKNFSFFLSLNFFKNISSDTENDCGDSSDENDCGKFKFKKIANNKILCNYFFFIFEFIDSPKLKKLLSIKKIMESSFDLINKILSKNFSF